MEEEEIILKIFKTLKKEVKIDESLYEDLHRRGSLTVHLYGLASMHSEDTPVRRVLSLPDTHYHKVTKRLHSAWQWFQNAM